MDPAYVRCWLRRSTLGSDSVEHILHRRLDPLGWIAPRGALVGRTLWLWLGVLDAIQGVGFGMILMQTLTRLHIAFAMGEAQVLGDMAMIIARASAFQSNGPGSVFPNLAVSGVQGLKSVWFWVCLLLQLSICVGFFKFSGKNSFRNHDAPDRLTVWDGGCL